MTAITEIEQEVTDFAWYAVDADERIARFTSGGFQLLPSSVSKSKEILETLDSFLEIYQVLMKRII